MIRTPMALLCLLLSVQSFSQDSLLKAKITGNIVDAANKKPLADASILFFKKLANPSKGIVSDVKGNFEWTASDTGSYSIVISHVGFKEQLLSINISPGFTGWHLGTIALQQGSGSLPEVVVRTDRPLVEQKADRLVYNAEKDLSTLGGTAADVLRNVPMLSVDGDGNVQLRGSSNIRVLINNRPSSIIAVSVADALRQLPADLVKTVEVITSPSARYDAEGTAGIINIITKKNLLQGVTGSMVIVPGNVSTIGNAGLNFRRRKYGLNFSVGINQFYNHGTTYLERYSYADKALFIQEGKTKNNSGFVSPRIGFDVSLDDKNSVSGGFAYNPAYNKVRNNQVVTNKVPGSPDMISNLLLFNKTNDIGYDINFDYLRTFKDPQQELSFLTLHSITNSDNIANQDEFNSNEEVSYQQRNLNKSRNIETTIQADYTQPLQNKTSLEMGAKTILRKASSNVHYRNIYPTAGTEWNAENIFSYDQDVLAAYLLYGFKVWKKLNVKLGGRYEKTTINANFKTRDFAFKTDYDNLIPSVNASYTFKEKHTLRMGYTQRLQRPQLFFLNPYREVITPKIIRQGNPELDAEVADLFEFGYGTYANKFSINASIFARITNNAITSSLSLVNDTTYIRFLNIAKNKTYGLSISGNVKPIKAWSLNGNINLYFSELQGEGVSNKGWMYSFFVGSNIDLGNGWWHGFTGSFNSRRVSLQGRVAAFYWHNTTVRKDIWKKRASIGINLANPFMKGTKVRNTLATATFEQREDNINYTRGIRLSFNCRFGSLQQKTPRKAKKAINNDDALRSQ
ncbi:MAG: outer membrane beta-barrel family protein [Chitinophagaceae bacterium]